MGQDAAEDWEVFNMTKILDLIKISSENSN